MIILLFLINSLTGCNAFKSQKLFHHTSCGPEALFELEYLIKNKKIAPCYDMNEFNRYSDIIRSNDYVVGSLLRRILSIVNIRGHKITWPYEMYATLKELGYTIEVVRGQEDYLRLAFNLGKLTGRKGIVLVKKENSVMFHWQFFPNSKFELNEFGRKGTVLKEIIYIVPRGKTVRKQK
jgi:hypothetical protein